MKRIEHPSGSEHESIEHPSGSEHESIEHPSGSEHEEHGADGSTRERGSWTQNHLGESTWSSKSV
jgi:hypothetical protein